MKGMKGGLESLWRSPAMWGPREAVGYIPEVASWLGKAAMEGIKQLPGAQTAIEAAKFPGIYMEAGKGLPGGSMQIFPARPKTPAAVEPSPAAQAEIAQGNPVTGAVTALADQEMNRETVAEATGSPKENVPDVVTQPIQRPGEAAPMEKIKLDLLKEENTRRRRIRFLEGMRDMAEGFGSIRVPTGYPEFDTTGPYIAETTRRQISREEDKLGAGEAMMLGKELGIDPEKLMNIPASRLKTWFPSVMAMKRTQEAANIRTAEQGKKREDSLNRMVAGNVSRFIAGHKQDIAKANTAKVALAMLARNNEVGDWAAVTMAIRGSGDNRINEGDISRWAGRTGLYKKLEEFFHRQIKGRMTPTLRKEFAAVLQAIQATVGRYIGQDTKLWARAYGGLGTSEEEYAQRFSSLLQSSEPTSAVITFKDERGKTSRQSVAIDKIDQAVEYIKQQGGSVVEVGF